MSVSQASKSDKILVTYRWLLLNCLDILVQAHVFESYFSFAFTMQRAHLLEEVFSDLFVRHCVLSRH